MSSTTDDLPREKALDEVRVVVVDDHDLFRTGLKTLLEEQGVNVVGEAPNGQTAIRLAGELAPDAADGEGEGKDGREPVVRRQAVTEERLGDLRDEEPSQQPADDRAARAS